MGHQCGDQAAQKGADQNSTTSAGDTFLIFNRRTTPALMSAFVLALYGSVFALPHFEKNKPQEPNYFLAKGDDGVSTIPVDQERSRHEAIQYAFDREVLLAAREIVLLHGDVAGRMEDTAKASFAIILSDMAAILEKYDTYRERWRNTWSRSDSELADQIAEEIQALLDKELEPIFHEAFEEMLAAEAIFSRSLLGAGHLPPRYEPQDLNAAVVREQIFFSSLSNEGWLKLGGTLVEFLPLVGEVYGAYVVIEGDPRMTHRVISPAENFVIQLCEQRINRAKQMLAVAYGENDAVVGRLSGGWSAEDALEGVEKQ